MVIISVKVYVKVFANLRDYVKPRPGIAEKIEVDVERGTEVRKIVKDLGIPESEIAIILINGVHKSLDTVLDQEGAVISLFSPVGGGCL